MQAPALPVRQDPQRGGGGNHAADDGIEQARADQHEAIAKQVEAGQRHQGDAGGGGDVAVVAADEEQQRAGKGDQQLAGHGREQLQQRPGGEQAGHGADDALDQAQAGGAKVRPAHEHRGQQDPVAIGGVEQVHQRIAGHQCQRDAHAMPEQHRGRGQLLAQAPAHLQQGARVGIAQPGIHSVQGAVIEVGGGQLALDRTEVAPQQAQRAQQWGPLRVVTGVQPVQRTVQVVQRRGQARCMGVGMAQPHRLAQRLAGLAFQYQYAVGAVQHIGMEEGRAQVGIRVVRGAGALVEILRHVVQPQVQARAHPRPAGAAETGEDGVLGGVQRRDHAPVLLGQRQLHRGMVGIVHRLEHRRFQAQVMAQLAIQPGQCLAHRAVGKQRRPHDRQQPVAGCPCEQVADLVPGQRGRRIGGQLVQRDHRVQRQGHRGLADRAVTFAQRAEQGQREGRQRQPGDQQ